MRPSDGWQRSFVAGQLFEVWEDPGFRFACNRPVVARFASQGEWVLLFNALALSASPVHSA